METYSSAKTQSWLLWFLKGVLILAFLLLFARLIELQIIKGEYYRKLSEENRIRRVPITASRGRIISRGGEVLVGNREIKKRVMFDPKSGYQKTDDITGASEAELISESIRDYKTQSTTSHITGYIGEASEDEVGLIKGGCPEKGPVTIGSLVGRGGLEEEYDCLLKGVDGEELVEVDVHGNKIRILGRREPVTGQDLHTTVDFKLQEKVSQAMGGKNGAIIITDPSGEILALYSSPSFDPNIFVRRGYDKKIKEVIEDKSLPLFNRVIGGRYPPGSTFKPLVSVAGIENGAIDSNYRYNDTGQIIIDTLYGKFSYSNWYFSQYGRVEGEIDITKALARSTDTFFYKIGELTGIDDLVSWSRQFGLDKKTEIDIPGEVKGFVPSPEWKKNERGEQWFLGNTYHVSIGQGDLAVTPVALNTAISAIVTGGNYCRPHLVGDKKCDVITLGEESVGLVKKGMVKACESGGTGYTFIDFKEKSGVTVGCKTGTAQTGSNSDPHAWFVLFAPSDNPEIILTVLVENGGEGSKVAGPIAREILNYWFGILDPSPTFSIPAQNE